MLAQIRGELMRQDEEARDRQHRRWLQRARFFGNLGLSLTGIGAGVGLIVSNHPVPGFFALGAGLARLAPEFTKMFLDKLPGGPDEK